MAVLFESACFELLLDRRQSMRRRRTRAVASREDEADQDDLAIELRPAEILAILSFQREIGSIGNHGQPRSRLRHGFRRQDKGKQYNREHFGLTDRRLAMASAMQSRLCARRRAYTRHLVNTATCHAPGPARSGIWSNRPGRLYPVSFRLDRCGRA